MTAIPRVYSEENKSKAKHIANITVHSMDDTETYGDTIHWLGFGEAVAKDLLTDYKVLIFIS